MATQHTELAEFVRDRAVLHGAVKLASGRKSDYYIDGKQVTHSPKGLQLIATAIRAELHALAVDSIGGLEIGAIPIVAAVSLDSVDSEHPIPSFIVRKEVKSHGAKKLIEGVLSDGDRVVVVDDVVTTGNSIIQAIDAVEKRGCTVVLAMTIVDRLSGAAEALAERNVTYRPLLTIEDLGLSNEPVVRGSLQEVSR